MSAMPFTYRHLLFATICLIWGTTWAATKLGVDAVPPMLFAGTRFMFAGCVVLLFHWAPRYRRGRWVPAADLPRLLVCAILLIPMTYAPLYWGLRVIPSGLAAVLNSALTPLVMLLLGIALGEERFSVRQGIAIAVGIIGLILLFEPAVAAIGNADKWQAIGMLAIIAATFASCGGAILARPLLTRHPAVLISGITYFAGGAATLLISFAFEPGARVAAAGDWGLAAWLGWFYIVVFGTLIGYTFYFVLLRDWGPSRSATYAFIVPIIAVICGVLSFGETVSRGEAAGMILMLTAAALALGRESPTVRR